MPECTGGENRVEKEEGKGKSINKSNAVDNKNAEQWN